MYIYKSTAYSRQIIINRCILYPTMKLIKAKNVAIKPKIKHPSISKGFLQLSNQKTDNIWQYRTKKTFKCKKTVKKKER